VNLPFAKLPRAMRPHNAQSFVSGNCRAHGNLANFNQTASNFRARDAHSARMFILIWTVALLLLCPRFAFGLDWRPERDHRFAELAPLTAGKPGFTRLDPAATGIVFTNWLAESRYLTNQIYLNGSGVAAGDVDGDGLCDLYFCGLDGPNVLYRNLGNWKFQDIAESAGVSCANLDASGATFADIDGDGDLDLLVNSVATGTHLFINDGKGRFSSLPPLNLGKGAMSMALADIDGDGDLDLYVANYRTTTVRDHPTTTYRIHREDNGSFTVLFVNGRPATEPDLIGRFTFEPNGKVLEHGEVDALFRNEGSGNFVPVSFTQGNFLDEDGKPLATPPYDWGLSAMFRDINGDGAPDLYVCNDFSSVDRIWINLGHGQFKAMPRLALRNTSMFSMGVDFADLNHDGHDDIFVADMLSRRHQKRHLQVGDLGPTFLPIGQIEDRPQYSKNTLFLNRGDNTYTEIAQFSRVDASEWSWTPIFLDVDLDGHEDLLITTGHELEMMNADVTMRAEAMKKERQMSAAEQRGLRKMFARLDIPNVAFRNRGDLTFEDASAAWGFDAPGVSHGMALADLDNDGDLDVAINNLNGCALIYRNNASAPRLAVRLKGKAPNTQGIGAKIRILGGPVPQSQEVICGGRYLSGDDPMRAFAVGAASNLTIQVTWRNGSTSVVPGVQGNRIYEIKESNAGPALSGPARIDPLFVDASSLLQHTHVEELFDDFARQPLLSRRLSQLGPGVSWHDVNGDGWDDLIIASGRTGKLSAFANDGRGGFKLFREPPITQLVTRDQTTVLALRTEGAKASLFVGSANYEDGLAVGAIVRRYDLATESIHDTLTGQEASTGPLAMGDVDGDGALDLFVGGRVIAGKYPEPADSILFRNVSGKFEVLQRFAKVGLVSGAILSDWDDDGKLDLILACEWGPVRVFRNEGKGEMKEMTQQLGLADFKGLWNGVNVADLNGDGKLEIIAGNWGLNHRYRTSRAHPRKLYYGDLDGNGTTELIESYFDEELGKEVPEQGLRTMAAAIPFVREKTGTFEAYGKAGVQELFGEALKRLPFLEMNTLTSMVFWNRVGKFEAQPLPVEAQWAPAFGISVGDMDGNGTEDLFLSQNFFAVHPETSRLDAGRGLWLRGDGKGGLTSVPGQESGVKIYGEQRGCAIGDYDGDGRVDLAVAQNGAATKLYRNVGAKPGLRVRLKGPGGNPTGVGAKVRLGDGTKLGAIREVHAGSGYWSEDSSVQVMGWSGSEANEIRVSWPGGKSVSSAIPAGAKEIEMDSNGKLSVLR
jgi:enediyne biosynthesis protein E4